VRLTLRSCERAFAAAAAAELSSAAVRWSSAMSGDGACSCAQNVTCDLRQRTTRRRAAAREASKATREDASPVAEEEAALSVAPDTPETSSSRNYRPGGTPVYGRGGVSVAEALMLLPTPLPIIWFHSPPLQIPQRQGQDAAGPLARGVSRGGDGYR
jgi:hypothetical protein